LTRHRAKQVGHSLNVIAELPRYVDDAAFPVGLRVAAIDAFFIHLRLLIEFLIKKPDRAHPAIHRDDYASGFNLGTVDPALYRSLSSDFDFASQHVAHFSLNRVLIEESAGIEYFDAARLRTCAEDVFGAMEAFIRYMHANRDPMPTTSRDCSRKPRAAWPRRRECLCRKPGQRVIGASAGFLPA
jgi:hypothetical protein